MAFRTRHGFEAELVPENFAIRFVEAKQPPLMSFGFFVGTDVAIQAGFEFGFVAGFDGSGDEDIAAPNDRAGVAKARQRRLPADILTSVNIPLSRRRSVREAACMRAAELRPIGGRRRRERGLSQQGDNEDPRTGENQGLHRRVISKRE